MGQPCSSYFKHKTREVFMRKTLKTVSADLKGKSLVVPRDEPPMKMFRPYYLSPPCDHIEYKTFSVDGHTFRVAYDKKECTLYVDKTVYVEPEKNDYVRYLQETIEKLTGDVQALKHKLEAVRKAVS